MLTEEQRTRVEQLARAPLESSIVTLYEAREGDSLAGFAYIDLHVVRTVEEALMVVLTPRGEVRSVRVLAFYEPTEYLPNDRWREQFEGRQLTDPIALGRDVATIAGATLSARATTRSVRRTLALYQVLLAPEPAGSDRGVERSASSEPESGD